MGKEIYQFEDIGAELTRPPLAASRALYLCGMILSPAGWRALSPEAQRLLLSEGASEKVDAIALQRAISGDAKKHLKLMPAVTDPSPAVVSPAVLQALGPQFRITPEMWSGVRSLDRYVLVTLSNNARLFIRAVEEIFGTRAFAEPNASKRWEGTLAACFVSMSEEAMRQLRSVHFLGGRALVLARATGRRAARRSNEVFDLYSDTPPGPVELDYAFLEKGILWQAHVSTWDGKFYPSASLFAATAAATCVADMMHTQSLQTTIERASIQTATWVAGRGSADDDGDSTAVFSKPAAEEPSGPANRAEGPANPQPSHAEPLPERHDTIVDTPKGVQAAIEAARAERAKLSPLAPLRPVQESAIASPLAAPVITGTRSRSLSDSMPVELPTSPISMRAIIAGIAAAAALLIAYLVARR